MRTLLLVWLILSTVLLAGCELIGDVFQAGIAVGVILVVLVIALAVWLIRRLAT